jgi:site-specific DNA recombinase
LVKNQEFAEQIKAKIGKQVDTAEIDKELIEYKKSLQQCKMVKKTLEQEIDKLPIDEPHRKRKLQDKNKRLNKLYDELYELEDKIDDLIKKRRAVETNALNLEQVYQILLSFDKLYAKMTDAEQRKMVSYLIGNRGLQKNKTER